jgi:xanthine/CO dehydrogenase XdhC/CoxF family maturation factor
MLMKELGIRDGIFAVDCPIGLNLGGTNPKEIAISVALELLKVNYGK